MTIKTIGRKDILDLPEIGLTDVLVKIDTGANRSAIHCSEIKIIKKNNKEILSFHIPLADKDMKNIHTTDNYFKKKIRSSNGRVEDRYVIKTQVIIFGKKIRATFSLTDRTEMKYPILLGRKVLKNRYIVDVSKVNLSYNEKIDSKID